MAFNVAEMLGVKHNFNKEKRIAGHVWLSSFLRRNSELSIRKAEDVSRARTEGMNRGEVSKYFELLSKMLEENYLLDKSGNIWNADETGVQMNNVPDTVARSSENYYLNFCNCLHYNLITQ